MQSHLEDIKLVVKELEERKAIGGGGGGGDFSGAAYKDALGKIVSVSNNNTAVDAAVITQMDEKTSLNESTIGPSVVFTYEVIGVRGEV